MPYSPPPLPPLLIAPYEPATLIVRGKIFGRMDGEEVLFAVLLLDNLIRGEDIEMLFEEAKLNITNAIRQLSLAEEKKWIRNKSICCTKAKKSLCSVLHNYA